MLPEFDEAYIPLALITLLLVVWVSGLYRDVSATESAAEIIKIGISAIAGYMSRRDTGDRG